MILADQILDRNDCLKAKRATWDTLWQDLADYVQPRKSHVTDEKTADVDGWTDQIYDATAIEANQVLAAGQLNYLTPATERWFEFDMPHGTGDDTARRWYRECTDIALDELSAGNFYLEVHEMYLDRGCFGTSILYLEENEDGDGIRFANHDVGTYSVAEDAYGIVDTVYREFELDARQMVERFGEENVSKEVKECYNGESKAKNRDRKFKIIHAVEPRKDRDPNKIDGKNKPIASVYVEVKGKHVILESGFDEMPYVVTRFLKWGEEVYGYCPAVTCLPTVRQINHLEKHMDALAELAAFPRMLVPSNLEGDVDFRSGGVTIFDENNPNSMPKEWATQGRYDIGKDRAQEKRDAINTAFHVDLFKMLAERQKNMTATEVLELVEEKLVQFSPTFSRLVTEFFNPMLQRLFGILYRQGRFPEPPAGVFQVDSDGVSLPQPKVVYRSRIAMAIKMLESKSMLKWWEVLAPMAEINPDVLDNIDIDKAVQILGANFGVPNEVLRSEEDVEDRRAARQEAQAAAEQAAVAKDAASAAKDFSQADLTRLPGI